MSESEDDIDYVEILKTINDKNVFLKNQEQNMELKNKFEEASTKYWDLRNQFLEMKEEFEINQIQMFKSNTLLEDSRNQHKTQLLKLEELKEKSEHLRKKSLDQQIQFETTVKYWNDKINELSTTLEEEPLLVKIQNSQSNVSSIQKKIKIIVERLIEQNIKIQTRHEDHNFEGLKQITCELNEETMDLEEKLKLCTELETEISEYGSITDNIHKQLHEI